MAAISSRALIPHIGELCAVVGKITNSVNDGFRLTEITTQEREFILVMIDLFPVFVRLCHNEHKCAVFDMLSNIYWRLRKLIGDKQFAAIWEGLKIGINEAESDARSAAYETFILFCCYDDKILKESYKEEIFINLLKVMENYCRYHREDHHMNHYDERQIFSALDVYCNAFGDSFVPLLPITMESLLKAMNPSNVSCADLNEMIISSFGSVFEIAHAHMLPYLPRLTEKLEEYLSNIFAEYKKGTTVGLAFVIGNGKFMIFFVPLALDILGETSNDDVRSGLLSLFGELSKQVGTELAPHLPKLVTEMVTSVLQNEFNAPEKFHLKIRAIESLKSLSTKPDAAIAPHTDSCYDAVYGQLGHAEAAVRIASVETLGQFVASFFQMNPIERSQEITARTITAFANTLKTDSSPDVAIAVFEAYDLLLTESSIVFDGKMQLFNEVFKCVNDVMHAKTVCQAGADFFDNMPLVRAADDVFLSLGEAMKTYEFVIYFSSILPVLGERFECAKQTSTENTKSFRYHVYRTLLKSIRLLKAHANTSFDAVLPILLSGFQDEYVWGRRIAIEGLTEFLLHVGENANNKSVQISGEFEKLFAKSDRGDIIEADQAIARLILAHNKVISVELFVPKIVEHLIKNWEWDIGVVFRCFHMLLNENNGVLLSLLNQIILIGLKKLTERQGLLSRPTRNKIIEFLKDCRKRFGFLVELALVQVPKAAKIGQLL